MVELDMSFLQEWKNITPLELKGIETLKRGMKLIFENIPQSKIIAIYLKGSFLRREMNARSDIDVSIIINDEKYLGVINELQHKYGNSKELNFGFGGYAIEELKTGKLSSLGKNMRMGVARFVRFVPSYRLIYGEKLDLRDLYKKTDLQHLQTYIKVFYTLFLPWYEEKKVDFQGLLKQSLWLFELEASVKNNKFKFTSWKELVKCFNKEHIIYRVLKLRESNEKDINIQNDFVQDLKKYIDKISKVYC